MVATSDALMLHMSGASIFCGGRDRDRPSAGINRFGELSQTAEFRSRVWTAPSWEGKSSRRVAGR
jgi:hypothetical protein